MAEGMQGHPRATSFPCDRTQGLSLSVLWRGKELTLRGLSACIAGCLLNTTLSRNQRGYPSPPDRRLPRSTLNLHSAFQKTPSVQAWQCGVTPERKQSSLHLAGATVTPILQIKKLRPQELVAGHQPHTVAQGPCSWYVAGAGFEQVSC